MNSPTISSPNEKTIIEEEIVLEDARDVVFLAAAIPRKKRHLLSSRGKQHLEAYRIRSQETREEQRRNRKVKGMFWASLHFSSKGARVTERKTGRYRTKG